MGIILPCFLTSVNIKQPYLAHVFHTTSHHNTGISCHNRLSPETHGFQAWSAYHLTTPSWYHVWNPCPDTGLSGRILASTYRNKHIGTTMQVMKLEKAKLEGENNRRGSEAVKVWVIIQAVRTDSHVGDLTHPELWEKKAPWLLHYIPVLVCHHPLFSPMYACMLGIPTVATSNGNCRRRIYARIRS